MKNEEKIERIIPSLSTGLTNQKVDERKKLKLVNKTNIVVGKSYLQIIFTDVFSFFNVLLFIVAGLMIFAQYWMGLTFMLVLIPNIAISLYEDIKARHLMSKLRVLNLSKVQVIRNGDEISINAEEIVLDDLIHLTNGTQIPVDGPLISGSLFVDESALTGESKIIVKNKDDYLYSGSVVINGDGVMHADKISTDSFVEKVQAKAKKFKRSPSMILKTFSIMFKIIGCIVITLAIATFVIYFIKGRLSSYEAYQQSIKGITGSMISMIPAGLFLLASVALAISVIKLNKKGARVQDFYSVEMLARVNVLCVDKTGTITNGEMDVKKVLLYGSGYSNEDVVQIVSNLLHATKDDNLTAKSLKKYFDFKLTKGVAGYLPFNSENKYSAASFKGDDTYLLGAPEFLNINNPTPLYRRIEEYTEKGFRVLALAKSKNVIKPNDIKVDGEVTPIALIILEDHIRQEAIETFKWFKENKVDIKVISGDDPRAVSHIAFEAGIEGAERYISLQGLTDNDIRNIVPFYNVFGRVSPEQKETIIKVLKENGNVVGMTGDGVNDILALKRADCSIAMNSGSQAAKNTSHIVLTNSNFDSLPSVVAEGRRVINNLTRTSSLFLTKTIFSVTTTTIFLFLLLFLDTPYPFEATHFQLWSLVNIGIASFFLALEPNQEKLKGSFAKRIFKVAIPGSIVVMLPVFLIFLFYVLQNNKLFYTGIYDFSTATTMSVICFTLLGLIVLLKICTPLNKYRGITFFSLAFIEIVLLIAAGFISYKVGVKESIIAIDFPSLTLVNWFVIAIMVVIISATYLIISYVIEVLKGERDNVKN